MVRDAVDGAGSGAAMAHPVTLRDLVEGLPIEGAETLGDRGSISISGIEFDSRKVEAGDLFVAWPGERFDGRKFASGAVDRGAVGVLACGGPLEDSAPDHAVPWLEAEQPRRLLGPLAARVYGRPDRELVTVGVTGTNGKTTTMFLAAAILEAAGKPCGTLGTLGYSFGSRHFGGERTTPEASDLFRLLRRMAGLGAQAASFEVSSHALDQGRVDETRLDVGVFTNLTRDHFDYHGNFENYFTAKRHLFSLLKEHGVAVICRDDQWGCRLLGEVGVPELAGDRRVLSYGESESSTSHQSIDVVSASLDRNGIQATLATPSGPLEIETSLLGRYNLWNVMAAVGIAEALEIPHEATRQALFSHSAVPGRLERVEAGQDFLVLIDYAHTDGALEATLHSVRSLWSGKLMVVFGCGGNRDQGKRPLMGIAASRLSDLAILTDDNPRDENPQAIHEQVLEGIRSVSSSAQVQVIGDRRAAIEAALERAAGEDGWAVVIAGKGHESGQTINEVVRPFNDRDEIERVLKDLQGTSGSPADSGQGTWSK